MVDIRNEGTITLQTSQISKYEGNLKDNFIPINSIT